MNDICTSPLRECVVKKVPFQDLPGSKNNRTTHNKFNRNYFIIQLNKLKS